MLACEFAGSAVLVVVTMGKYMMRSHDITHSSVYMQTLRVKV